MSDTCPKCGKRLIAFTLGDGVPVCDCGEEIEKDVRYIKFNGKYWKVEDLREGFEIEVVDDS